MMAVSGKLHAQRRRSWWEFRRIRPLVMEQRRWLYIALGSAAVFSLSQLALPVITKYLFDEVIFKRRDITLLWLTLGALVLLLVIRSVALSLRIYSGNTIAHNLTAVLRQRLFEHLQQLSYSFFDRSRVGDLMSRLTNDVVTLQNFITASLEELIVSPMMLIGALVILFVRSWQMGVFILAVSLFVAIGLRIVGAHLRRINQRIQDFTGELTGVLSEGLNVIRLIQSFNMEGEVSSQFYEVNRRTLKENLRAVKWLAILLASVEFIGMMAPLVFFAFLAFLIIKDQSTVGDVFLIVGLAAMVANPLNKLSRVMAHLQSAAAAIGRIYEILDTPREIRDLPGAKPLDIVDGAIKFDGVGFSYDGGGDVLSEFNLEVSPGEVVALVGDSGSGKTTVLHLIPRFYEPKKGAISIDGQDISKVTLSSLRRHIGLVSQETILVHGTLRENISFGTRVTDELDVIEAAKSANAHDFIMKLPHGYDTIVGERGVTLSGGERQRISIARALLKDPRILLLDEATSALDSISEAIVQDALNKLMYGRTTVMVAHRLSTVKNANRIIVLDNGRIREMGSHRELVEHQGYYYSLVKLQGLA
jgi:subfamily B ATP-binding cassette protein MsbA